MSFDRDAIRRSMEEFDRRKIYASLDPDVIGSIDDSNLEQAIADFVINKIGDHFDRQYEIVTAMPPSIQAVILRSGTVERCADPIHSGARRRIHGRVRLLPLIPSPASRALEG